MTVGDGFKPSLATRVAAKVKGEVRADTLEAYRRAGGVVYGEMQNAEALRLKLADSGVNLWHASPGDSGHLLATWNAFVLQSIGEHMLDADYAADPRTAGYVPPVTNEQVRACFDQVEGWVSKARQTAGNPDHDLREREYLPADLPAWAEADPCPLPHLRGMLAATRAIRQHAEVAFGVFQRTVTDAEAHRADLQRLRQLAGDAATASDYAEGLLETDPKPHLHEEIEERLQRALQAYHHLGQLIAMPTLIRGYQVAQLGATSYSGSGSGSGGAAGSAGLDRALDSPGFDPWCLTAPMERKRWRKDPRACQAIKEMWDYDPDRRVTLRVQAEIDAALRDGVIGYCKTGSGATRFYYSCPWGAIYEVSRPVLIGGKRLRPGERFTYDVCAEEMADGGDFTREILVSNFTPTKEIDYCDPDGLHDE